MVSTVGLLVEDEELAESVIADKVSRPVFWTKPILPRFKFTVFLIVFYGLLSGVRSEKSEKCFMRFFMNLQKNV